MKKSRHCRQLIDSQRESLAEVDMKMSRVDINEETLGLIAICEAKSDPENDHFFQGWGHFFSALCRFFWLFIARYVGYMSICAQDHPIFYWSICGAVVLGICILCCRPAVLPSLPIHNRMLCVSIGSICYVYLHYIYHINITISVYHITHTNTHQTHTKQVYHFGFVVLQQELSFSLSGLFLSKTQKLHKSPKNITAWLSGS